jgi:hypothetical protein
MKAKTPAPIAVKCLREISGEYLTAGEVYTVTLTQSRKGSHHFQGENGATFLRPWSYAAALASGQLEIVA